MGVFVHSTYLLLLCSLSSCSLLTLKTAFHPTIEDKKFSVAQGQDHWKKATTFAAHGLSRSAQLLEIEEFEVTQSGGKYPGGTGMAALISADGYALTAYHVVSDSPPQGIVKMSDNKRRPHFLALPGASPMTGKNRQASLVLFPKPEQIPDRDSRQISIAAIRVVFRFPGRDLALIKLPSSQAPFFEIGERPDRGDRLFSSGNGISAAPFRSAGQVIKTGRNGQRFLAQMPSALGDSGGPVFNANGQLVGILIQITPEGPNQWRGIRICQNSCCEVPDKAEIQNLISADRLSRAKKTPAESGLSVAMGTKAANCGFP